MTETKVDSKKEIQDLVISIRSSGPDICRICHSDETSHGKLISPCLCSGSVRVVHEECLNRWIDLSKTNRCELCTFPYCLKTKIRWEWLPLCSWERKNLIRSIAYTFASLGWVIASLIIVTKSSIEDLHRPEFQWRLWTNLVMQNIGLISVIVFLCMWGKFYVRLLLRLKEHNRMVVIDASQSPSEKTPVPKKFVSSSCSLDSFVASPGEGNYTPSSRSNFDPRDVALNIYFGYQF